MQYPQPDRFASNRVMCSGTLQAVSLAVSSTGSLRLKRRVCLSNGRLLLSCSILNRIASPQTVREILRQLRPYFLQYPQPDRFASNRLEKNEKRGVLRHFCSPKAFLGLLSASIFTAIHFYSIPEIVLFRKSLFAENPGQFASLKCGILLVEQVMQLI